MDFIRTSVQEESVIPSDFFDRELDVGDFIVWPTRRGSGLRMNYGIVEKILPTGKLGVMRFSKAKWDSKYTASDKAKRVQLTRTNTIVKIGSLIEG